MKQRSLTASHWGVGLVESVDGKVVSVGPHPEDPDPSRINENIASALGSKARVLRPAVRKSYLERGPLGERSIERGREGFVEVSWDQALDLVAKEIQRVKDQHGNSAIFGGSYGWASAGRFHHAQSQLKRFLNAAGGFVRSEGNYSYNSALVLMPHIVGNFRHCVAKTTRLSTVAKEGELVVMFGGIPARNAQVAGGGVGRHRLRGDLLACAKAGVKFVNFSPLRQDALEPLNARWLAPRPGSDTAVMMGLAHTLLAHDLHDLAFLERYCVGFDKVEAYLRGDHDGQPKDADWAAQQSGIAADEIRALALEMAQKRTLISTAFSLQRADYGEQPFWMTVTLAAMLGQIGLPGGGFAFGYGGDSTIGTVDRPVRWPSMPQGDNPIETFIPVALLTEMLLRPGETYDYDGQKLTYPDIRLVWWAGGNPFHHHQDLNRLRRAFQKPETIIVNEIGWTATARHADIVLPVAAPLERNDFAAGSFDCDLIPMPQASLPAGEARCEYDIYCDLEKRMGLGHRFSEGRSIDQWLAVMWQDLCEEAAAFGKNLPSWEDFLRGDVISFPDPAPDGVFLSDFRADPQAHRLRTPSGRIELASDVIGGFDYDDCPGQATWFPPRAWQSGERENFPLHLISGQPATRLHSQYDSGAYSLSLKIAGREPILINPKDAQIRGIVDGQVVKVRNKRGQLLAGAKVTEDVAAGTVFLWTGAWFDPDFSNDEPLDRHGNPNVVTHDLRTSRLSQGPAAQSAFVEIETYDSPAPEVMAFEAPIMEVP